MAQGEWVVSDDITLPQAREKSIQQAKLEALRKAGVPEYITESNISYQSDGVDKTQNLFESITTIDVFGEITEYEIIKEEKKLNEFDNIIYTVWINATVVIHKEGRDPGFSFDIKGIREGYGSPDKLSFNVTPWMDGYLRVFIISDKEGIQLYPNQFEPQEMLKSKSLVTFPKSKSFEYEISTEKRSEINYLILVFTKQDIPFLEPETPQNILRFIGSISPSKKSIKTFSLLIKK